MELIIMSALVRDRERTSKSQLPNEDNIKEITDRDILMGAGRDATSGAQVSFL